MNGICTLANDYVYDQLVALLNSIEAIAGIEMPVCVYPYDDRCDRIQKEIAHRPNVQLYADQDSIQSWDQFVREIWDAHPTAQQQWQKIGSQPYHRVGTHRRFCAFDAPFDRFIYMDADTLLLGAVQPIFQQLETRDWVVYDFQRYDPTHVYNLTAKQLNRLFSDQRINTEIFCSGFYASRRNLFGQEQRDWLLSQLRQGEAEVLYPMAPDQTILNYMVMRSNIPICNLAIELSQEQRTGNCVTSTHFEEKEHLLYDQGNRLTYLHYIGLSAQIFQRVCAGENISFPYREVFLHYRYLREPEQQPVFTQRPKAYNAAPSLTQRVLRRLRFFH
jgi:hypothetical protein